MLDFGAATFRRPATYDTIDRIDDCDRLRTQNGEAIFDGPVGYSILLGSKPSRSVAKRRFLPYAARIDGQYSVAARTRS